MELARLVKLVRLVLLEQLVEVKLVRLVLLEQRVELVLRVKQEQLVLLV